MPSRQRQFPELVAIRTPVLARQDLSVPSISEVSSSLIPLTMEVNSISGCVFVHTGQIATLNMQVPAMSGTLNVHTGQISTLNGQMTTANTNISSLNNMTTAISGDLYNADLSLTAAIFNMVKPGMGTPTISASPWGWGRIDTIANGPFYIALYQ